MQTETNPHEPLHSRPFPIGVVYNGQTKHEPVTLTEMIKDVLARAIKLFHVTQQPHMLSLFDADGNELGDNTTVGQNGINAKTILYLRQSRVKGGAG